MADTPFSAEEEELISHHVERGWQLLCDELSEEPMPEFEESLAATLPAKISDEVIERLETQVLWFNTTYADHDAELRKIKNPKIMASQFPELFGKKTNLSPEEQAKELKEARMAVRRMKFVHKLLNRDRE